MLPSLRTTSARARRRARRLSFGAVTLTLLAGGCSGGSDDGASDPAPSSPATSSSESDAPTATFGFDGQEPGRAAKGTTRVTIDCQAPRTLVTFSQLTVDHEVELRSIDAVGTQVAVGRSWISDVSDDVPASGEFVLGPGPVKTQEPGWPKREPLKGYVLEPGTVYTYFVEIMLGPEARQQGFSLGYRIGDDSADAEVPDRLNRGAC